MVSIYPNGIDSSDQLPIASDNVTAVNAEAVNVLRDAVIKVESELGINPSSTYTTVRARLDAIEAGLTSSIAGVQLSVKEEGALLSDNVTSIDFVGSGFTATLTGPNSIEVNLTSTGGSETLAETLALGNTTGGNNITLSAGDVINSASGPVIVDDDFQINGKLTVSGLIDPTGIVLDEQSAVPFTTTAGKGTIWVRNDTPNVIVFTDDAGTDNVLGAGGEETLAQTLAFGNLTGGRDIIFSDGDDLFAAATDGTGFSISFQAAATGVSGILNLVGQTGNTGNAGGDVVVTGGAGAGVRAGGGAQLIGGTGGPNGAGGVTLVRGGAGGGTSGAGAAVNIQGGSPQNDGSGGAVSLQGSSGLGTNANGGNVTVTCGNSTQAGTAGLFSVTGGTGVDADGGSITLISGESNNASGGSITLTTGTGPTSDGDITLSAGLANDGTDGKIIFDGYVDAQNNIVTNIPTPINPLDAVNKAYVDGQIVGAGSNEIEFMLSGNYGGMPTPLFVDPPYHFNENKTVDSVTLIRRIAGSSGNTIVDLLFNGSSIFGANPKPTVDASNGNYDFNTVSTFDTSSVSVDGYMECELETIEGGSPEDFRVIVRFS